MLAFRSPRTTNEQRQADGHHRDGLAVRPKRRAANLPDAWDDVPRATTADHSWKRFRVSRWRRIRDA